MEKYAVTAIACIVVQAEISGGEEESGEEQREERGSNKWPFIKNCYVELLEHCAAHALTQNKPIYRGFAG